MYVAMVQMKWDPEAEEQESHKYEKHHSTETGLYQLRQVQKQ